jgi:hypothetical protein
MVNIGLNPASLVGIILALAGAGLYALRSLRPKVARDHDIFFAAIGLLCGGILFFQGWRLDPILQFNQFLLVGAVIFFAVESIRLRSVATEQARRAAPIVDDERPVSRKYEVTAELEQLNPYEDRPTRRIRGSRDVRPNRDEYEEGVRPRRTSRSSGEDRLGSGSMDRDRTSRKRRPRPLDDESPIEPSFDSDNSDMWEDRPNRSRSTSPSRSGNQSPGASRPRRPRPSENPPELRQRRSESADSSEYVDYRPVDGEGETDNWGDY